MSDPPAPARPLLAVRGLAFSRNETPVFGPLDFVVEAGEALLVQGANGAGKTSLLRVLAGLLRADAGELEIDGVPARADLRARFIAYLGHLPGLKGDLSTLQNLEYLGGLHGRRDGQTPEGAMEIVGLAGYEDAPLRTLSAGQKKRLGLARLWLSPAPLWLLDEPYANLDLEGINLVNRMVQAHLRAGGAALVTTHGAYAAPPVRTRMLELGAGRSSDLPPAAAARITGGHATPGAGTSLPEEFRDGGREDNHGLAKAATALVRRDLQLLWARRGDALQPALFALLTVVLFALGLGGDAGSLAPVAAAVLWLAVLLAGLLALDSLFRGDAEDGSLEQWMLSPVPLWWLVLVRTGMHWATTALPVIIAVPVLGELMYLPRSQLPVLLATLLLGTPILSLLGAVVAALTVGMRRAGVLVALLALPLYVPVLVFGAGAVAATAQGLDAVGALLLLGAGLTLALVMAPLAAATALRVAHS